MSQLFCTSAMAARHFANSASDSGVVEQLDCAHFCISVKICAYLHPFAATFFGNHVICSLKETQKTVNRRR
jgi:hypothetical protein